jgi:hypothetical protein
MAKISTTTKAWITSHSDLGPDSLMDPKNIANLSFSNSKMESVGWTFVGEAEITVDLVDTNTLIANKVDALRNELSAVRAQAQMEATRIESRINDLLCLTFDATVEK